jgi:hypothetical protein
MVTLHLQGEDNVTIAQTLGYTPQQVSNILNSPDVLEILDALRKETINSMAAVQAELQLYAPELLRRKIDYALNGADDRVRNLAQTELLHIAGHTPIRRVTVENKNELVEKYKDKSEQELRDLIAGKDPDRGPDGNLLQ